MAPDTEQKDAIACAAAALSRAWGKQVLIDNVSALSDDERRNLILRATAHGDGAPPRSVIVKATRGKNYAPATDRAFESGLVSALPARGTARCFSPAMPAADWWCWKTSGPVSAVWSVPCSTARPTGPGTP